ncbi:uncharacterized protein LOC113144088 [Mastacembelus armatus]|uniref:Uncharacterized LOC113144088 n=1 Tax=Mastacembelus armatus TaxID=205130 RepID=A0A3Q3MJ79_9TELE|nr:uncharacterized protein LOC113144088 [Mastacembelus armatus]
MIMLWITLLFLHQGYSLVPVITVQFGQPATFTCSKEYSRKTLHWYKQSPGETLKIIVTVYQTAAPEYGPEFNKSRLAVNHDKTLSSLTILRTVPEDEGMYHCAVTDWINVEWWGIYLLVKGNTQRTSNYSVVQSTVSDPVRPGDSVTLQCSVLSDSESDTCPRDHSVYWFRAGSDESHPNIIYTDGNNECEKRSDTVKSCVYHFSKNINSSDAGTYYCAVATCGQILFGNGTKLDIVQTTYSVLTAVVILTVCLAVSVVGNVALIYHRRVHEQSKEAWRGHLSKPVHCITEAEDGLNYAALNFSERKATRSRRKGDLSDSSADRRVPCTHVNLD